MLLSIDIGNTNITCGLFKGKRLIKGFPFSNRIIEKHLNSIEKIAIVSVAPKRLEAVLKALRKTYKRRIYIIGKDIKVPLKSRYNRRQIGQDRLVTAYAALNLYGAPLLIIDFGTAVTFDIVSKRNVYLGGLILPGIKMSLESLYKKTALLPQVELKRIRNFIGRNTADSIRSGMIHGYVSICEGLISRFKKRYRNIKIIATGGDAKFIAAYTPSISKVDENLSLKGLTLLMALKTLEC